jgi:hypothetical protein
MGGLPEHIRVDVEMRHPRIFRRQCTTHGRSSATLPHIRRYLRHHSAGHSHLRAPTPHSHYRGRLRHWRAPPAGLPRCRAPRHPGSGAYPRPSSRSADARASTSTVMSPTSGGTCASASSTSSTTTTWRTGSRLRSRWPRCSSHQRSRLLTLIPRLPRPAHPRCPLHALAGVCIENAMVLHVTVKGHQLVALLDSDSTTNFINADL